MNDTEKLTIDLALKYFEILNQTTLDLVNRVHVLETAVSLHPALWEPYEKAKSEAQNWKQPPSLRKQLQELSKELQKLRGSK